MRDRASTGPRHGAPEVPRPGERLVRAGAVVFGVGVLGIAAVLVPFLLGRQDAPLWTTLVASLMPIGLALSLLGLLRGARSRRQPPAPRSASFIEPERNTRAET